MTGVILVNMGSPSSRKEMKQFLFRMFSDVAILPFPFIARTLLAFLISNFRYRSSWKKYELIGFSPLKESMNSIATSMVKELGFNYIVISAYSYSFPTIRQGIDAFYNQNITNIKVIPMFPQSSFSTTESVKRDILIAHNTHPDIHICVTKPFSQNKNFIAYWISLINETKKTNKFKHPTLLFSAHAIPVYQVEKGDTYCEEINASANRIATEMKLPYKVSFQSKIGNVKWVKPDTKDCLKAMKDEGCDQIILIPISFINENLETLYDQEMDIIPYGINTLNIKNICRVKIPATHPLLIETFKNILWES